MRFSATSECHEHVLPAPLSTCIRSLLAVADFLLLMAGAADVSIASLLPACPALLRSILPLPCIGYAGAS